ncbi:hypothetical protein ACFR9U_09060 [Halorientalis brevis]|uniref:ROK family protein n=1 Tax=Halorientalis brevis TaxID=1126241 RepID=A0ABD6C9Y8_9EURY|nr:hypothetical protein [Halorientalis brevis]
MRSAFQIDRRELEACESVLEIIDERIGVSNVTLATVTYSYGNGISEITDIESVSNRGVKDLLGLGYETGAGAVVFDQLQDSSIPAVVLPGVHDGLETLHPLFRHHSTWSGGDKVAAVRSAQERFRATSENGDAFIWACASSSCMSGLVSDGRLRGFFHWLGLVHGWPDLEAVRHGKEEGFDDILMQCGILPRQGHELSDAHEITDPEILKQVYWSTLFNIHSLVPFAEGICGESLDGVLLSGRLVRREQPIDVARRIYEQCTDTAPVHVLEPYASARGAALVAEDVGTGAEHVLGIPVGDVPIQNDEQSEITLTVDGSGQTQ